MFAGPAGFSLSHRRADGTDSILRRHSEDRLTKPGCWEGNRAGAERFTLAGRMGEFTCTHAHTRAHTHPHAPARTGTMN